MMENIKVKNFLIVKNVNIEIKNLTLFIGPQAAGKSIIAKLLYFFREFLNDNYLASVKTGSNKKKLENDGKRIFSNYFPTYAWETTDFEIKYTTFGEHVTITNTELKSGNYSLKLDYSKGLTSLHRKLKHTYQKKSENWKPAGLLSGPTPIEETFNICINNTEFKNIFSQSLFIPAARSFYSTIKNNVFSFLSNELNIDPFLSVFGSQLEKYKNIYGNNSFKKTVGEEVFSNLEVLIGKIIKGQFRHSNQYDWIVAKKRVTELAEASSGQQEAMPLLVMLCSWALYADTDKRSICFIEEPEAHLFPTAQKDIMTILGYLFNHANQRMLLTTHSPYILAALNNLILADDVKNKIGHDRLNNVMDANTTIPFDSTQVYLINNGKAESILDHEERLIDASALDDASYDFEKSFDYLLDMLTED